MISYSLHLSNKKHALTTTKKVAAASKHNLRQYESPQYCRDNIFVLVGGDNILDDLKEALKNTTRASVLIDKLMII